MALGNDSSTNHAGVKRPLPSSSSSTTTPEQVPPKRRKVHHALRHIQVRPAGIELAPQDPVFAQGQLLKSISSALVLAGFDSVKPTALEMFRSHVEEYMLRFLAHARTSMHDGRRSRPTPLDFAAALANTPTGWTASLLRDPLAVRLPDAISCPAILAPPPAPAPAPDFSALLQPLIDGAPPTFIPAHFPARPPTHAWKQTPVFPQRETDPKKMREKATQEGVLAEQALRKLAAAAKTGAMNAEQRRRGSVLCGAGKAREPSSQSQSQPLPLPRKAMPGGARAPRPREDTFADMLQDLAAYDDNNSGAAAAAAAAVAAANSGDIALPAQANHDGVDLAMPEGVAVNYEMAHWRKGGSRRRGGG